MSEVSIEQIHEDLLALREEVRELKQCFHEDLLKLTPDVIKKVNEARERMKKEFVSHEDVEKEFG